MKNIITKPTTGTTCEFAGYYAPAAIWRALGAQRSYAYSNNETGVVDFGGGYTGDQKAAYAAALLAEARVKLAADKSRYTDEDVIVLALTYYRRDAALRAQGELCQSVNRLASALTNGLHVSSPELTDSVRSLTTTLAGMVVS